MYCMWHMLFSLECHNLALWVPQANCSQLLRGRVFSSAWKMFMFIYFNIFANYKMDDIGDWTKNSACTCMSIKLQFTMFDVLWKMNHFSFCSYGDPSDLGPCVEPIFTFLISILYTDGFALPLLVFVQIFRVAILKILHSFVMTIFLHVFAFSLETAH